MPSWFKKAEQSNELTRKPITQHSAQRINNNLHFLHAFMV